MSTQKTASIWWCCCGCSLKFICREWSKEKAFRQIALWISALHLLLFLACGTHVVCHEWNAAERRVKGEKIWKRQEDPDMNLTHPQNAYINWSFAVWGKSWHADNRKPNITLSKITQQTLSLPLLSASDVTDFTSEMGKLAFCYLKSAAWVQRMGVLRDVWYLLHPLPFPEGDPKRQCQCRNLWMCLKRCTAWNVGMT